jgi:hypothetical protein
MAGRCFLTVLQEVGHGCVLEMGRPSIRKRKIFAHPACKKKVCNYLTSSVNMYFVKFVF